MKNTPLNGYLLHQRAYQEKRAIYQFFSYEHGVVHGVGVRGMPLFTPVYLLANGNHALKSFSQIGLGFSPSFEQMLSEQIGDDADGQNLSQHSGYLLTKGRVQYALLYMNEVLYKLLANENACPALWQTYHTNTAKLHALDKLSLSAVDELHAMKVYLRIFERALFAELGVAIDFGNDGFGEPIVADGVYRFVPQMGFVPDSTALPADYHAANKASPCYQGLQLQQMDLALQNLLVFDHLAEFGQIHKQLMDFLLDYRPLHSRTLWQQSMRYLT
ncbi:DNA repair protein RecO [Moraxella marmotae]|uniref:DNA repair protein RecO n=1 Tax=Moraxella marmotae TaxID=3344520 RepID=UPI0035F45A9D